MITLLSSYKVDEVFAFHEGGAYIVRYNNGYTLHLIEGYVAKNEIDTNQREPMSFKELTENEKLCPVETLDKYLEMTAQYVTGRLFRNSRVGSSLSRKSYTSVLSALAAEASGINKLSMTVYHIKSVATSYAAARGGHSFGDRYLSLDGNQPECLRIIMSLIVRRQNTFSWYAEKWLGQILNPRLINNFYTVIVNIL